MLILLSCFRFESLNIHWSLHSKTNLGVYMLKIMKKKKKKDMLVFYVQFYVFLSV